MAMHAKLVGMMVKVDKNAHNSHAYGIDAMSILNQLIWDGLNFDMTKKMC